ncbi:MAG: NHLP leader peptide family natural product precursor [Actinobacteria bacterium]|nr:NHLP leader peptide family natural product precursor [Actinomycetota bacterium]
MAFDLAPLVMKAATDHGERAKFLADPRGYLEAHGVDVPGFVEITAVEIDRPVATVTFGLPPMPDPDEISEVDLDQISGGHSGNFGTPM